MSEHTPGEWKCKKSHDHRMGSFVIDTDIGFIASVWERSPEVFEEDEANARLIAAAPTMYEALVSVAYSSDTVCDPRCGKGPPCDCVGDVVRAAIAKATGQE